MTPVAAFSVAQNGSAPPITENVGVNVEAGAPLDATVKEPNTELLNVVPAALAKKGAALTVRPTLALVPGEPTLLETMH